MERSGMRDRPARLPRISLRFILATSAVGERNHYFGRGEFDRARMQIADVNF